MKLLNQDFKKAMQGYKAVKTICKSAKMTFCGDETVIQSEDVELSYGHDQEFDEDIMVDESTLKLMEKCKDDLQREFYIQMTKRYGWTKRILTNFIEAQTYEKYLLNQTNFDLTLPVEQRVQAKLSFEV